MNYITSTQLRTKTSEFIEMLLAGKSIQLIHRSKNLGTLNLSQNKPAKPFNSEHFLKLAKELNLPKTTYAERDKIYRKHLLDKYGHNLS